MRSYVSLHKLNPHSRKTARAGTGAGGNGHRNSKALENIFYMNVFKFTFDNGKLNKGRAKGV